MLRSLYQVKAYNIKHGYNVNGFLEAYRVMLQKAIDEIWIRIKWIEKHSRGVFPPSQKLFNELMKGWSGFTQTGEKAYESFNEPERSPKLMNPQSYICL